MNRILQAAFLSVIFLACGGLVRAAIELGADEYVNNAICVEIVRVQGAGEAADFPPPRGMRRVLVEEVLKGIDTTQEFLVPEGTLKPDEKAVVLFQYDSEQDSPEVKNPEPKKLVWPMDAATGLVNIGYIPAESSGGGWGRGREETSIPLKQIKDAIAKGSPEEVGLNAQVIDALLFPEKNKQLAAQDSMRATYVRFVLALHDLARDIPALSLLLESRDKATRDAALARLVALAGKKVDAPDDETAHSLNEWSVDWGLVKLPDKQPEWPPVPKNSKMPKDAFPAALLKAVSDDDADAFAKAFPEWLDSGVMRDRQIEYAENTLRKEVEGSPYFEPDGKAHPKRDDLWPDENLVEMLYTRGMFIAAERLPVDIAVNPKVPAELRLKYMAILAEHLHRELIERDQAARLAFIKAEQPGSEAVRRAAFWEVGPEYTETARSTALEKLASVPGKSSQQLLMAQYLAPDIEGRPAPSSDALDAARASIKAGNKEFINALLGYVRTHQDSPAEWGGRLLCQEGRAEVIPIMIDWLKAENPEVRSMGAFNLCWIPRRESVPALLAAIEAERLRELNTPGLKSPSADKGAQQDDDERPHPKEQMIVALAQTDDPRGLDTLIAAAREPYGEGLEEEVVRGLGRIRDKKALPVLAKLAGKTTDLGMQAEIVNSFDYILRNPGGHEPDTFWGSGGIYEQEVRKGIERIKQWQKEYGK